ncbi:MAG TPA: hypothetical protein VFG76_04495 [Candidatus Polarisedimenticolia bacterium]|nr:hypothetical protein [Candidatus Polarisedimenticolia bacterium]
MEILGRTREVVQPKIERIDRTINLALLSLGPTISTGLAPTTLAERTPTSGTLRTARWRGPQLEAAASRVIRFEVERAAGGMAYHAFLHMRTDMASGGWSEPVFADDSLVGLTVSQDGDESRAIPVEILQAFLDRDADTERADGFTTLGVNWQLNKETAVSRLLGQTRQGQGILVRQVPWGSTACGVLKPRDILLELAGRPIDSEGYYQHEWLGRLSFNHILAEKFRPGEAIPARVLREGKELEVSLTARAYPAALDLVPIDQHGAPAYIIVGGLVVRELDLEYLRTWGKDWSKDAPDRLLSRYMYEQEGQTRERRRAVLITSVLPWAYNVGYHELRDVVIDRINGHPIGKIEDVTEALRAPQVGFHVIDLAPESWPGQIVLDAATLESATAEIMKAYDVPAAARPREEPLPEGGGDCPGDY